MIFLQLLFFLWVCRIIANILSYSHLWWTKEYRFDRMVIHLKSPQGKRILFPSLRRPPMTPKSVLLLFTSAALILMFFVLSSAPVIVRFIFIDLLSFPLTWIIVGFLNFPTKIYHRILIAQAIQKLQQHKKLLVVGITGSYGKTSVKEFLSTILASKYRVLKTEASKNSPIGIAEVVMSKLRSDHEIFVVEMGAYKRGEIAEMAEMVKPQIGIVTAINPQHQDLFGTIENTMKAKYELIEGLTGKRVGIFNADDPRVNEMSMWAKRDGVEVGYWSRSDAHNSHADFDGVEFTLGTSVHVRAPVFGEHQISNILAAIVGSRACGMSLHDAASAVSRIRSAKGVMEKKPGINGSTFIDDTFNNNPDAAKAAIEFLKKAKGRKILVFQPMIELGAYAESAHKEVGKLAESVCDEILLTNNSYYEEFSPSRRARIMNARDVSKYLHKILHKNDTVLFKGKEAGLVLQRINMLTR